jgi:hypothetical protein
MVLPSAIVNPALAGEISSARSIVAISCSIGLPGTTSATNFIVHFIRPAYPTPQLCILSSAFPTNRQETPVASLRTLTPRRLVDSQSQVDPVPAGGGIVVGVIALKYLAIHIHEPARQRARDSVNTPAFVNAQRQRKKVEALFAELKNQIGVRRLRLRRLKFVREQFFLAAAAQNIKKLVRFLSQGPRSPSRQQLSFIFARNSSVLRYSSPPTSDSAQPFFNSYA